jgi:glycerol-3-phosphate acyltransferase PlsY
MHGPLLPALILIAYLAGSIPFGLLVGLAKGVDPRKNGSGNIGATNIGRLLGGRYFALVFTLDILKSFAPVLAAGALLGFHPAGWQQYLLWLVVGMAAVIGHMFSVFLGFKGGKGVATSAGVLLGLFPYYTVPGLLAILIWIIVFKFTRYVSLASILGTSAFPVIYVIIGLAAGWPLGRDQLPLVICAGLIAALIVFKHRGNITRLRAGTENRFAKHA